MSRQMRGRGRRVTGRERGGGAGESGAREGSRRRRTQKLEHEHEPATEPCDRQNEMKDDPRRDSKTILRRSPAARVGSSDDRC
eukprot:764670-Hanusia_phi.AAC.4